MINHLKKIVNNLKKAESIFRKSKEKVGDSHEKIGRLEKIAGLQKDHWEKLGEQNKVPPVLVNSGRVFSRDLLSQSKRIFKIAQDSEIEAAIFTASGMTETGSAIALSGTPFVYPPDSFPYSHSKLVEVLGQGSKQEEISQKLKAIDANLADKYDDAWSALYMLPKDETRAPMFLIREVLTGLYHYFAPKGEVQNFFKIEKKEDVKRSHQIKYIASQIESLDRRQFFLKAEEAFNNIFKLLNKAHKPGKLDTKKTESFLYQADALIELLLNSLD